MICRGKKRVLGGKEERGIRILRWGGGGGEEKGLSLHFLFEFTGGHDRRGGEGFFHLPHEHRKGGRGRGGSSIRRVPVSCRYWQRGKFWGGRRGEKKGKKVALFRLPKCLRSEEGGKRRGGGYLSQQGMGLKGGKRKGEWGGGWPSSNLHFSWKRGKKKKKGSPLRATNAVINGRSQLPS